MYVARMRPLRSRSARAPLAKRAPQPPDTAGRAARTEAAGRTAPRPRRRGASPWGRQRRSALVQAAGSARRTRYVRRSSPPWVPVRPQSHSLAKRALEVRPRPLRGAQVPAWASGRDGARDKRESCKRGCTPTRLGNLAHILGLGFRPVRVNLQLLHFDRRRKLPDALEYQACEPSPNL